jgi:DNA repair protein RecO (recombination protein O)
VLRRFELRLLSTAGYGLNLSHEAATELPLDPSASYEYHIEQGPVAATGAEALLVFQGADLLAIGRGDLADPRILQSAKRLLRAVLAHYLSGRALRTRQVVAAMRR